MTQLLAAEARRRARIFRELDTYLRLLAETVRSLDPEAEVYLFGSVAEGRYNYSSDIDVLVVTRLKPATVLAELWRRGIEDPFEVHVVPPRLLPLYRQRARLVRVA